MSLAFLARQPPRCRIRPFSTIPNPPPLPPTRARRILYPTAFLIGSAVGVFLYNHNFGPAARPCLDPETFTAYTLASHTAISTSPSQTSILMLVPPVSSSSPASSAPSPSLSATAPFSPTRLQSVEVKHPQVQIARHYTPLPSTDADGGAIRLLVKREPAGEMSRYLFSLPPSSTVELRGPHTEYDLFPAPVSPPPSGGGGGKLLFLAGGTGIAPALQCAHKLLSRNESASMRILWAVRHRAETEGAAAEEVERLKRAFGGRLEVGVFADAEGGIGEGVVRDGVLGWGAHRVLVSGPEGFVEYWAGSKGSWVMGKETQGPVGGFLATVLRERPFEVWKL